MLNKEAILTKLKTEFTERFYSNEHQCKPTVFISYPWVSNEDMLSNAEWDRWRIPKKFLEDLYADLKLAGFEPYLDYKTNDYDKSVTQMMKTISSCDYVLCFLTPVFKAKATNPLFKLSDEYKYINQRLQQKASANDRHQVRFYIYDGQYTDCVPEDWNKSHADHLIRRLNPDYNVNLKILIRSLYNERLGKPGDTQDSLYETLWNKLIEAQAPVAELAPAHGAAPNSAMAPTPSKVEGSANIVGNVRGTSFFQVAMGGNRAVNQAGEVEVDGDVRMLAVTDDVDLSRLQAARDFFK